MLSLYYFANAFFIFIYHAEILPDPRPLRHSDLARIISDFDPFNKIEDVINPDVMDENTEVHNYTWEPVEGTVIASTEISTGNGETIVRVTSVYNNEPDPSNLISSTMSISNLKPARDAETGPAAIACEYKEYNDDLMDLFVDVFEESPRIERLESVEYIDDVKCEIVNQNLGTTILRTASYTKNFTSNPELVRKLDIIDVKTMMHPELVDTNGEKKLMSINRKTVTQGTLSIAFTLNQNCDTEEVENLKRYRPTRTDSKFSIDSKSIWEPDSDADIDSEDEVEDEDASPKKRLKSNH